MGKCWRRRLNGCRNVHRLVSLRPTGLHGIRLKKKGRRDSDRVRSITRIFFLASSHVRLKRVGTTMNDIMTVYNCLSQLRLSLVACGVARGHYPL